MHRVTSRNNLLSLMIFLLSFSLVLLIHSFQKTEEITPCKLPNTKVFNQTLFNTLRETALTQSKHYPPHEIPRISTTLNLYGIQSKCIMNTTLPSDFETASFVEDQIAPLISAFLISNETKLFRAAKSLTLDLLGTFSSRIPPTFIRNGRPFGAFNQTLTFSQSISSIYPILASVCAMTGDSTIFHAIKHFYAAFYNGFHATFNCSTGKAIGETEPYPPSFCSDAFKVFKILPSIGMDFKIPCFEHLTSEEPLFVGDQKSTYGTSIEACMLYNYADEPLKEALYTKCKKLAKNKLPVRLTKRSFFGSTPVIPSFQFEGELLDMFWSNAKYDRATKYIEKVLQDTIFDGVVHGVLNVTSKKLKSDGKLHSTFFTNFLTTAYYVSTRTPSKGIIRSRDGHLLFFKD